MSQTQETTGLRNDARSDSKSGSEHSDQNIESVVALHRREWETVSQSQRRVERIGQLLGRPAFLGALLAAVSAWLLCNGFARVFGVAPSDPPPFAWLHLAMTFTALLTTAIVLIAQTRQTRFEQHYAHLDLQVNLLTEQKVTKLIHLLEELRRDLPMVRDRHDPQAQALQEQTDPVRLMSAIDEVGLTSVAETVPGKADDSR